MIPTRPLPETRGDQLESTQRGKCRLPRPSLTLTAPGKVFLEGDPILVSLFQGGGSRPTQVRIMGRSKHGRDDCHVSEFRSNPHAIDPMNLIGPVIVQAEWLDLDGCPTGQRSIAIRCCIVQPGADASDRVIASRTAEHQISSSLLETTLGAADLHDPWVPPPACREDGKWFPIAIHEGASSIYNEEEAYYHDPLEYFAHSIDSLIDAGYQFQTWHDVQAGAIPSGSPQAVIQFDVDAGPRSMLRVADILVSRGIRASIMMHARALHWYEYDLQTMDLEGYRALEQAGWAIGYHNNSLTNLAGYDYERSLDPDLIAQASDQVACDVEELRRHFTIRTLTHHGGNVTNYRVPVPDDLGIRCVDRNFAPDLWEPLKVMFSDGGFLSRPCPLGDFADFAAGRSAFLRIHPVKYGNYEDACDLPPLDSPKSMLPPSEHDVSAPTGPLEKQVVWLRERARSQEGVRLGFSSPCKPISRHFASDGQVASAVGRLREDATEHEQRTYPWGLGDPRAFWWRFVQSQCTRGRVLCVGASGIARRGSSTGFLPEGVAYEELGSGEATAAVLRNFARLSDVAPNTEPKRRDYAHVLLPHLELFSDPAAAMENAAGCLAPGGSILCSALGASDPEQGGWYRPEDRPLWRLDPEDELAKVFDPTARMWSFDRWSLKDLLLEWTGPNSWECFQHRWFILVRAEDAS